MNLYRRAPAFAEFADVAGLVTDIVDAAAVMLSLSRRFVGVAPSGELRFLLRGEIGIGCVAEHEPVEAFALSRGVDAGFHDAQAREDAADVLVADCQQHGRACWRRLRVSGWRERCNLRHRVVPQMKQPESQRGVADPEHAPGRGDREGDEDPGVNRAPAVATKDRRQPRQQHDIDGEADAADQAAAVGKFGEALQPGGRRRRDPTMHLLFL